MANNLILERLLGVKKRFVEVGELLNAPDVMSDMKRFIRLNKEYKELKPVVEAYERYKSAVDNLESTRSLLAAEKDEEMREMAKAEIDNLLGNIPDMEEEIRYLLLPADPEDEKNAVMEIRAGTGGDEASILPNMAISTAEFSSRRRARSSSDGSFPLSTRRASSASIASISSGLKCTICSTQSDSFFFFSLLSSFDSLTDFTFPNWAAIAWPHATAFFSATAVRTGAASRSSRTSVSAFPPVRAR